MKEKLFENEEILYEFENGILTGTFKLENYDLETVQKLVDYRLKVTEGKSLPTIANIISIKNIHKDARDFFASEEGCRGIIAAAILIDSSVGSMIGNFWMRINKPLRPTKIFTNEIDAKKWLEIYK